MMLNSEEPSAVSEKSLRVGENKGTHGGVGYISLGGRWKVEEVTKLSL
jgi:hypothetical protein